MIYGAILFRFFGVITKWTILNIYLFFKKKKTISFKSLWNGRDPQNDDLLYRTSGEFGDILIGAAAILLMIGIIKWMGL
ncbi:hypothetical protein [Saccharicrinis fermentans]|uniref:Uncharacterized protein n=1 Tax=Saccharicrinis fermentans DSM 9555 = JCM 21142 TaxID=869213 RepID=W7Y4R2_9BACT|nr:hypothetical protein [Saccharicrinis fermentans]GAF05915.1 hypothetical protein JCM21142_124674 [Saccharicrinis fermentans DSM 9555 = JCM 21142]